MKMSSAVDRCRSLAAWAILVCGTIGVLSLQAMATEAVTRAVSVVPDQEKRSMIQEVDGYAYLSEDKTLAQTRSAAMANAKRQAVEQAKTYISSKTKV